MKNISLIPSAVATAFFAFPAQADITAAELLAEWKENAAYMNGTLEVGAEVRDGDTLRLEDYVLNFDTAAGEIHISQDWIEFREIGDGSLELKTSPDTTMRVTTSAGYGADTVVYVTAVQRGLIARVTGTQKDHAYDAMADKFSLSYRFDTEEMMSDMVIAVEFDDLNAEFSQHTDPIETGYIEGAFAADTATITADMSSDDGVDFQFTTQISTVLNEFRQDYAPYLDVSDLMENGYTVSSLLSFGNIIFEASIDAPDGAYRVTGSQESGSVQSDLTTSELKYDLSGNGFILNLMLPEFGLPSEQIAFEKSEFKLIFPTNIDGDLSDASMRSALTNFTIDDDIWAIFDPDQNIPRDPASYAIDLTAQIKMFENVMAPNFVEFMGDKVGEIISLKVNEISANFGGVLFSSAADLVFENAGAASLDDALQPSGNASFELTGAFGLIGTLVNMGLLPSTAAFAARTGIATFATQDDEDHYASEIEFTSDGGILVNGVKYK